MNEIERRQRQYQFEKRFWKVDLLFSYFSRISCLSREAPDQFNIYLNTIDPDIENHSIENIIVTFQVEYQNAYNTKCLISDLYKKYDLSEYQEEMSQIDEQFLQSITNIRIVFNEGEICIQYLTKRDKQYRIMTKNWYEVRNILVGDNDRQIIFRNSRKINDFIIGVRMKNFKKEIIIAIYYKEKYIIYDMKYFDSESLCKLNSMITRDMIKCMNERMNERMKEIEERLLKIQGDTGDGVIDMIEEVMKKKENEIQLEPEKKRVEISFTKEYFEMSEDDDMNSIEKGEIDIKSVDMNEETTK